MLNSVSPLQENIQVSTLRENKEGPLEDKVSQVAIDGLKDTVMTIYNNTSQISDFFLIQITDPKTELIYKPLLAGMDQNTAYIHLDKGTGCIQSYRIENDFFSIDQFYQSLVGKDVKMYHKEGELIEGKVIEWNSDILTLYNTKDATPRLVFYKRDEITGIECDNLDTKMSLKPSLKAHYITDASEKIEGQLIQLNNSFNWRANYRLVIEETKEGFQGKLEADAKISNRSGRDLKNVVVKVVSGNLHINMPAPLPRTNYSEYKSMPSSNASHLQLAAIDQKWHDLKAYLIPYKMNLLKNETVSTRLFDSKNVKLNKSHVLHSYEHQSGEKHPSVCYLIENTEENHLGQAFPDGHVQVYRKEGESIDIIGQHRLEQTPKGKDLKIITSESFDLLAKRSIQTQNVKDLFQKVVAQEHSVKIELTNGSDENQTVFLHEHLSKGYSLIKSDGQIVEKEGEEIVFEVNVPKNTTAHDPLVLTYQYRRDFI